MRVRVPSTLLHQAPEATGAESIAVPRQHVAAQLIDGHLKYEPRWLGRVTRAGANHECKQQRHDSAVR